MHLYYFISWLGQTLAFWLNIALIIAYLKLYRLIAHTKFSVHRPWIAWSIASCVPSALAPISESLLFRLRILPISAVRDIFVFVFWFSVLLGAYGSYVLIRVLGEILANPVPDMSGATAGFD